MSSALDVLSDIPVSLALRMNCRGTTLDEMARLEPGGTIALDRLAGEPLDLYVGDLLLGSAEVVIIEDRLNIRITNLFLETPEAMEARAA